MQNDHHPVMLGFTAFILMLSGCAEPEVQEPPITEPPPTPDATFAFGEAVVAISCNDCNEATIEWTPEGELLVSQSNGERLARSTDNGTTWTELGLPPIDVGVGIVTTFADGQLQRAPDGTIWFSMIHMSGNTGGIRVLSTEDGGQSWATDTLVETSRNPAANAPDRNWLGFTDEEILLFCICTIGVEPAIFSSDDGQAFEFKESVIIPGSRSTPWGVPAVFNDGRIHWASFTAACDVDDVQTPGVQSATNWEGEWQYTTVSPPGGGRLRDDENNSICGFPNAGMNETHVAVAWNEEVEGQIQAHLSFTDGTEWSEPVVWTTEGVGSPHPWIAPTTDGRWLMMSYGPNTPPQDRNISGPESIMVPTQHQDVIMTRGDAEGPIESVHLGTARARSTDLTHFSVGPDGRVAATWVDDAGIMVSVQEP